MQLINDTLAELALAAPQGYANLAVYPLIASPAAAGDVHERLRLALLQRHQQVLDVIALAHAIVAQGVAVVP